MDPLTVSVFTALVIVVSATLFLVDTVRRHDAAAGQLWSLGYLAAVLTTLFYLVWAWQPGSWWAVAGGNAAFIVATGGMWLGCRAFNRKPVGLAGVFVAATSVFVGAAVGFEWETLGDWAGAAWMFVALVVLASMAAAECFSGELRRARVARPLGIVFSVQAAYYLLRTIAFLVAGPESAFFQTWFSTAVTSVFTVTLTITSVVCTSVLQATRSRMRGGSGAAAGEVFAVQSKDAFRRDLTALCHRAAPRQDLLAVAVVHFDDLASIERAFGADVSDELWEALRDGVLDGSPTLALVGETGEDAIGLGWVTGSAAEARRQAMALYRSLLGALDAVTGGALPGIGIGVAVTDLSGYDPAALLSDASGAAQRGAAGWTTAVVLADSL